jgi:hypothetical protein
MNLEVQGGAAFFPSPAKWGEGRIAVARGCGPGWGFFFDPTAPYQAETPRPHPRPLPTLAALAGEGRTGACRGGKE